ncbi:hypothetical protein F3J12_31140 [Burkholderia sp. Ax-1735]|nr:hypothetical protein [Burkholderia sp. Ap-955]NIF13881.1 hypothetical protein [Burkholderia sp. Ax-1735]NIG07159.1 hypothetical protein [Burkholderia sp. Tr-849]
MPADTGGWNRGDGRASSNERKQSSRKTTRMQCGSACSQPSFPPPARLYLVKTLMINPTHLMNHRRLS